MADAGEDDDLSLVRASSSLLQDLEKSLPRLLYRRTKEHGKLVAHSSVRHVDLEHTLRLIDPFQSDPQLLDTHLKTIVPQIADALLQHLARGPDHEKPQYVSLIDAASTLLYNLCKVRGRKIVAALLPNEPRHLELVVAALERHGKSAGQWQTRFSLLLWLSHLLLAPFALATISSEVQDVHLPEQLVLDDKVPQVARRCICIALSSLGSSSIAQAAAALVLARLVTRPDMQVLKLADDIVDYILPQLSDTQSAGEQIHRQLGALRLLVAVGKSGDVDHLFPRIFAACESHVEESTSLTGNAVARKLILKAMSTLVLTSLRSARSDGTHTALLNEGDALETTIEYHLRCLADHESLVRHAAAKSISAIVLGLDSSMSQDILDAVLQAIEEETPADGQLHTANAFAWHGNVLTLAYALFKRSISIERLPAVVRALLLAIAFEQRTANGAVTGTSVRDAANFGLWSLARRFTTRELSGVDGEAGLTIFELLAVNLLQAACLDPVGNIRRGSSAALQELVGRHPDRIPAGISLVQVVDFVAVGLRRRAMLEVAAKAAALDNLYWTAITTGLAGWRGLGSADAASREYAAQCIPSQYAGKDENMQSRGLSSLVSVLEQCSEHDYEQLHGLVLCFAYWISHSIKTASSIDIQNIWAAIEQKKCFINAFTLRALRTELTLALIRFTTAYCDFRLQRQDEVDSATLSIISEFQQRLFSRHEESIREKVPMLVRASHRAGICFQSKQLVDQLLLDCSKPTLHGCGRAHALAELTVSLPQEMTGNISVLCQVCSSSQVDWRVVGYEALSIILPHVPFKHEMFKTICKQLIAGMRDYTIDQRGDVGSLVRLQAIEGTQLLLIAAVDHDHTQELESEILRLSLERLNRVRAAAAKCRMHLPVDLAVTAQEDLDSEQYFEAALSPLWRAETPCWARRALLEGVTSCAGSAAEHLIQNSRAVLARTLSDMSPSTLSVIMQDFTEMLKTIQSLPLLDLLAFFLQARILQRLTDANYKWRNLLAIVQRAHYKSTDIPKILTAVSIYACLSEKATIKTEVVKKLLSMLKTNPYPKVRSAVADALYTITLQSDMKTHDWSRAPGLNKAAVATLETTL